MVTLWLDQSRFTRQQLLHHALLHGLRLVELFFQRGDVGIHVGEDGGDGGLFLISRSKD